MSSPKDFFLVELGPLIAQVKAAFGARIPKVTYDIEFEIDAEFYTIAVKDGDATVRRGGSPAPLVALLFSRASWDEALTRIIRPRLALLGNAAHAEAGLTRLLAGRKLPAPDVAIGHVKALPLRVVLALAPSAGERFEMKLGGAEEDNPTVTVRLSRADFDALVDEKLRPHDAFKAGRLRVEGAVSTLMALLSRLAK